MEKSIEKRNYDRAFKDRAVKLSHQRTDFKELADELGISRDRLYKWRSEFARHGDASFPGHGVERLSDEVRQVKELQKKLRNTELELEILKKAIAVFSKIDR
jgi:transposase